VPPAVTPQRAQQLFSLVVGRVCCPASCPPPCIPFLYPDDGCWARAHEMCRLMIADGAQPEKIWIFGTLPPGGISEYSDPPLHVISPNKPECNVRWYWHVAPTLQVTTGSGTETWIIDPSLFPGPVPKATWVAEQRDPSAALASSSAVVYLLDREGVVEHDPTYSRTNNDLQTYRNKLKLRSAGGNGPPPYFNCMTKPAGVQWFGSVPPNATRRWFTWGWGGRWHVVWTVMPLTPCPGAPQLSWSVAVERANATQCTYWITVRNLTSDPVKFEGRYDVLSW
jgi:hypothetical protein